LKVMMRVALDAMGGDFLAAPNLLGAYSALAWAEDEKENLQVLLCAPQKQLEAAIEQLLNKTEQKNEFRWELARWKAWLNEERLVLVDCDDVVGMDESPSVVVRSKKNSSMAKCFHLVKEGRADAALSAGNSGAMMAYGIAILGRLPSVKRPAILCHFPSQEGVTALLDSGANVDCTPAHLEQFAWMGKVYMQSIFEKTKVKVALLNIGEEEGKGNDLVKETHELLKSKMPEEYMGYVEGRDLLTGRADVIVCDGFVGNVVLKTAEGVAKAVGRILKEEFSRSTIWSFGAWLAKGGFMAMKSKLDYREYGAAPLIGLQGLGLIAHGSSDAKAISSAIRMASRYAKQGLMEKLKIHFSTPQIEEKLAKTEE